MSSDSKPTVDPIFESSLRESKWILLIWAVNFVWVVGYCGWFGYPRDNAPLETVLGMPSWVFWGVFVPWIVAAVVSSWFALRCMSDHSLEASPDPSPEDLGTSDPAAERTSDG